MQDTLYDLLQQLNELLIRERLAIIGLKMDLLSQLQTEKTDLLEQIHKNRNEIDDRCRELAARTKAGNRRNAWMLRTSLQLIARRKENVRRQLSLTYSPNGTAFNLDSTPRILTRRL